MGNLAKWYSVMESTFLQGLYLVPAGRLCCNFAVWPHYSAIDILLLGASEGLRQRHTSAGM